MSCSKAKGEHEDGISNLHLLRKICSLYICCKSEANVQADHPGQIKKPLSQKVWGLSVLYTASGSLPRSFFPSIANLWGPEIQTPLAIWAQWSRSVPCMEHVCLPTYVGATEMGWACQLQQVHKRACGWSKDINFNRTMKSGRGRAGPAYCLHQGHVRLMGEVRSLLSVRLWESMWIG